VTTLRVRLATTNTPESRKRGLLRDRLARARRLFRFYDRRRIDVCSLQEAGTYAELVDAESAKLKALWAHWNQIVRGRRVGNGVVVNTWRWKSRLLEDITVGTGDEAVHIAVVLITERPRRGRDPFKFKLYAVHRPTRRATNANLRSVIDDVLKMHIRYDDKADRAWVIAGDFNVSPWNPVRGVVLGSHGVDHIVASHHFEPVGRAHVDRPLLSDHEFLIADAVVEV
jgi:exonuclease III